VCLLAATYVTGGVAWNVKNGAPLGTSALPHLEFWRQLPDLVKVRQLGSGWWGALGWQLANRAAWRAAPFTASRPVLRFYLKG
jgi:hypothetical protein